MKLLERANGNLPRTDEEKDQMIGDAAIHYGKFLTALGFDYQADENSKDTPRRVAKAWINDIVSGCVTEPPKITAFPNEDKYSGMVFEGDIPVTSLCSHHNLSFSGKAYVAYLPGEKVIGLSKINRIVDWFARRPQIQEGLTAQIHNYINEVCEGNLGVAVMISCEHSCVSCRGIKHNSTMKTAIMSGAFLDNNDKARDEFYQFVNSKN